MIFPQDVQNWFTYHSPQPDMLPRYQAMRQAGHALAMSILQNTPTSVEQSEAIMHVRKAIAMANAAIACQVDTRERGAA